MSLNEALKYAHANRERYLSQLFDFLRIPSISTQIEHKSDIQRAAEWVAADMRRVGLMGVQVIPTTGNPIVYGEWLGAGPDAPTVLIYGHYDVQPVDPIELWQSPPFEPQIRDGFIYARGVSDDKGQMFVHMKAIESMLATSGRLPVNVKLIFEGEEEIGSVSLEAFVPSHREMLAADVSLVSDTGMITPDQPLIVYGLRGISYMEFRIKGPKRDLHSGGYGGTVYNPAQLVAEIIAALHDDKGAVTVPGFYERVRPLTDEERRAINSVPYSLEQWQSETGLRQPWGEPEYTLQERIGARPTCEVNGIWGGWQGEGGKTIIPAEAGAKISMRLVPDQDPQEIAELFTKFVKARVPDDMQVQVNNLSGGWWAITPLDSPAMQAASRAYQATWGVPPVFAREGGSIPIVATFQKELNAPAVLMGFGLRDDAAHAPNEHFREDHFYKGIDTVIHYFHYLAE